MSNGIFSKFMSQSTFYFQIKQKNQPNKQSTQPQISEILPIRQQKNYLQTIVNNLCQLDSFTPPRSAIWVNWQQWISVISTMIAWHKVLKLNKLILPDAITILDRCLANMQSDKDISRQQLNCLIMSSFWISTKKHSRKKKLLNSWLNLIEPVLFMTQLQHRKIWYSPQTTNEQKLTLIKLVKQNLALVQAFILQQLQFNLDKVNALELLLIFGKINKLKPKTLMLARYFQEISFYIDFQRLNKDILQSNSNQQAQTHKIITEIDKFENTIMITILSSLYLSCFFEQKQCWPVHYLEIFSISPVIIDKCASHIFQIAISAKNNQPMFSIIFEKYNRSCYMCISNIQFKVRQQNDGNKSECQSQCSTFSNLQSVKSCQQLNLQRINFEIRALNTESISNIPQKSNQQILQNDLFLKPFFKRKLNRENKKLTKIKEKHFSWASIGDIMETTIGENIIKNSQLTKPKKSLKILKIQPENKLVCI